MITLEKVNNLFIGGIVKKVNEYICSIPNHPAKMLLKEDYYTGFGYRFWHIHEKGYFQILRLYDHAEVLVKYVGQDELEIIANIFESRIAMYYPYAYIGSDRPNSELRQEFHDYCHRYAHIEKPYSAYNVSANMAEINIPYFLEEFMTKGGGRIINDFYSGRYSGHRMCFDEKMGYLYIIPLLNKLYVYPIGTDKKEAFENMLKTASKDTLHFPWEW